MSTLRTKSYLLLLIASAIWGIAGPVIKFTLTDFPPSIFLLYRFALSAIIGLIALGLHPFTWPKSLALKFWIILYCFLTSTVSLGLLFVGYDNTSAIAGSVINAIYPIMVAAVGVVWLNEHVTHREKTGMGIALIGTLIAIFEPLLNTSATHTTSLLGNMLVVASLVIGVVLAVMAKLILRRWSQAASLTHLSFIIGFITILPITLYSHNLSTMYLALSTAPLTAHLGVLYMALLSGTLAYTLWHQGQKSIETSETAIFSYTYPIFTLPLSIFFLHEPISVYLIISTLLIALGVIVAQRKSSHPNRHR